MPSQEQRCRDQRNNERDRTRLRVTKLRDERKKELAGAVSLLQQRFSKNFAYSEEELKLLRPIKRNLSQIEKVRKEFQEGPTFVCFCCHRLHFFKQVHRTA